MSAQRVVIAKHYKLPDINNDREPQKLYWYKGIKMSAKCVCDLMRINEEYFLEQADVHGCQTANMIVNGEIEVPESAWINGTIGIDLKALAKTAPVGYDTLLKRYKLGDRDEYLVRPRSKTRRKNV